MRILLLSGVLLWAICGNAQSDLPYAKINTEISNDKFLAFYQEHGFAVGTITQNGQALPDFFQMYPEADLNTIDPLELGILPGETHKHFRLGNTGKVVIFYSEKKTRELYERYLLISKN